MSAILRDPKTTYSSGLLTKYAQKQAKAYSLLSDDKLSNNTKKPTKLSTRPITHWKPSIVVDIAQPMSLNLKDVPGEISHLIRLDEEENYLPIIFISEIRTRVRDLWPVNKTNPTLPITVNFEPTALGKIRFMLIAEASMKTMHSLGFSDMDTDDVKGIFFDTNIFLLLLTVFVTSCHVSNSRAVFSFLNLYSRCFLISLPSRVTYSFGENEKLWLVYLSPLFDGGVFHNLSSRCIFSIKEPLYSS